MWSRKLFTFHKVNTVISLGLTVLKISCGFKPSPKETWNWQHVVQEVLCLRHVLRIIPDDNLSCGHLPSLPQSRPFSSSTRDCIRVNFGVGWVPLETSILPRSRNMTQPRSRGPDILRYGRSITYLCPTGSFHRERSGPVKHIFRLSVPGSPL